MTRSSLLPLISIVATTLFPGCAGESVADHAFLNLDQGRLQFADTTLNIPGLGPCNDNSDRSLHLGSQQPVIILVHGASGSPGQFHRLSQEFALLGQQTVCFKYNERDSLMESSGQLRHSLDSLAKEMKLKKVTVIGYSLGSLVARKSMVADRPEPLQGDDMQIRLVSVSGPFAGIQAAHKCESTQLIIHWICELVMGDKWLEITHSSDFILRPGALDKQVREFLEIVTDERDACRQLENGVCVKSDYVFSMEEQRNPVIDSDPVTTIVEVKAGHNEIVGDNLTAPAKLISILRQHGIVNP